MPVSSQAGATGSFEPKDMYERGTKPHFQRFSFGRNRRKPPLWRRPAALRRQRSQVRILSGAPNTADCPLLPPITAETTPAQRAGDGPCPRSVETAAFGSEKFESLPVDWSILTRRRRGAWGFERPLCALMSAIEGAFATARKRPLPRARLQVDVFCQTTAGRVMSR